MASSNNQIGTNGYQEGNQTGKRPFRKGNPGRPKGIKDKRNHIRELVLGVALGKGDNGAIRITDALRRLHVEDPKSFVQAVGRFCPPPADSQRVATSQLTLAALIQVLDQQPARIVDARVIEAPALATDECTDGDASADGDEAT